MLKHLMNGSSLLALALREGENEQGVDPREEARNAIAKGTIVTVKSDAEKAAPKEEVEAEEADPETEEEVEADQEEEEADPEENKDEKVEFTDEEKAAKEKQDREEAKLKRKEDRVQKRIDAVTAERNAAKAEVARLTEQLNANPDNKLTKEEVQRQAEAIAAEKLAEKEAADIKRNFDATCDRLAKEGNKLDPKFDAKINEMAEQFGPIPTLMIRALEDVDNASEVLVHLANDDDAAEKVYGFANNPARMIKELVKISISLEEAKKPKPKPLSRVPSPTEAVKGHRVESVTLTDADTKDMDTYVRKRQAMMAAKRKAEGY